MYTPLTLNTDATTTTTTTASIATATTATKDLRHISYRSRVIAHFAPNFVAIAMGQGSVKKNVDCSIRQSNPENPLQTQKSCRYLLQKMSYKTFCLKFRCHGRGLIKKKCNLQHSTAHP